MAAPGRRLVVDADVAQSAGESSAERSRLCRELLSAIGSSLHRVVLSEKGDEEWRVHQSTYSRIWLRAMEVSGQVVRVKAHLPPEIEAAVLELFESARRTGVAKDLHLIAAALETDRIVLSNEVRARRAMGEAARAVPDFATIHWANPTDPADSAIAWVADGARDEPSRQLGFKASP